MDDLGDGLVAFTDLHRFSLRPGTSGAARPQEPDPNRGFGDALFARDFLRRVALHLQFEQGAVARRAKLENTLQIDGGEIQFRRRVEFRESLIRLFAAQDAPVNVQRDGVHPGYDHAIVAKLT